VGYPRQATASRCPGRWRWSPPPRHLPITIADRLTGATSISRRKPNSRSQTIRTAAENTAVNSTDHRQDAGEDERLEVHPGRKVAPGERRQAGARTSRNSSGWISDGHRAEAVPAEPDQFPGATRCSRPAGPERRLRSGTATLIWVGPGPRPEAVIPPGWAVWGGHAHRLPRMRAAIARIWFGVPVASASRMVLPV